MGVLIRVASLASRHGFGFSERAVLFLSWCDRDRMLDMKRVLGCVALGLATLAASAQWSNPTDDIPAYNRGALLKTAPAAAGGRSADRTVFLTLVPDDGVCDGGEDPWGAKSAAVLLPV